MIRLYDSVILEVAASGSSRSCKDIETWKSASPADERGRKNDFALKSGQITCMIVV